VDQQEIELVQPEPLQAAFGRALQVAFMQVITPDFCRDENLVTRHACAS